MSKAATLCQYQLPTGKACRQIALSGEQLCRHHRRLFRHSEAEACQEKAMERLAGELLALDLPGLLYLLYRKLNSIRTTLRSHHEAQLALAIAFQRLREQLGQTDPEELPTPINFPENPTESMM